MRYFSFFACLFFALTTASVNAQDLKLDELNKAFSAPAYPNSIFNLLETKGFNRLDKQYPDFCERVIYFHEKNGKPDMFINPQVCTKAVDHELYPEKVKNEMQLQFQKSSRASFENLSAQIRKQCKPLPAITPTDQEENAILQAYRHPATGTIFLIQSTNKVCFIYLLK